jgi:hypothetical protein
MDLIQKASAFAAQQSGFDQIGNALYERNASKIYPLQEANWFKALPYCFQFKDKFNGVHRFYLPISPSNITTITPFATNVIPTLYSTVEEHSDQRYYDISIQGTTGIAPQYYGVNPASYIGDPGGRTSFEVYKPLLGGFAAKTESIIKKTVGLAIDAAEAVGLASENPTGVSPSKSGYAAFHNFYRFLLVYKKEASGSNANGLLPMTSHPLAFINYKDGVEYDCAITHFVLRRSAESPMLYNYEIKMRCYNMRGSDQGDPAGAVTDIMVKLGLSDINNSIMSKVKNAAGAAKGVVGGLSAGFKVLGS